MKWGFPWQFSTGTCPCHCDIQQRVPMNPNRDVVASGYPVKLHVACLPTLPGELDSSTVKDDCVGTAGKIRERFPGLCTVLHHDSDHPGDQPAVARNTAWLGKQRRRVRRQHVSVKGLGCPLTSMHTSSLSAE